MKLKELVASIESLNYLLGLKLPATASFKLAVFVKKVSPELDTYNKTRNEKLTEYGDELKDEDGKPNGQYKIKKENIEKYNSELEELLNTELSIDVPEINIADFGNIEIEAKNLVELDWLIKA